MLLDGSVFGWLFRFIFVGRRETRVVWFREGGEARGTRFEEWGECSSYGDADCES